MFDSLWKYYIGLMEARMEADHEEILSYVGKPENSDKPFEKEIEGIMTANKF